MPTPLRLDEIEPNEKLQKILDRIKKLLALSTSDNPNEAKLALEQAQALMTRHSIEEAAVNPTDEVRELSVSTGKRFEQWEITLTKVVADTNGCVILYTNPAVKGGDAALTLCGKKADLLVARYMLGFAKSEFDRLCKAQLATKPGRSYMASYRVGLSEGFCITLLNAYKATLNKMKQEIPDERALVHVGDDRVKSTWAALEAEHGNKLSTRKSASGPKNRDATAEAIGRNHGKNIDPNRNAGGLEAEKPQISAGDER